MPKRTPRPAKRKPPYYAAYRLQSIDELEAKLNELLEGGFAVKHVLFGLGTYTVVALMPDL